jgi:hypothetical protein
MIKILFLFLLSFSLFGQSSEFGFYWFKNGSETVKATGSKIDGAYDPAKSTVIYFHGWQSKSCNTNSCRNEKLIFIDPTDGNKSVDLTSKWITDNWNVGVFYWTQYADENEVTDAEAKIWSIVGPKKMRYKIPNNTYTDAGYSTIGAPTISIGDLAYNEYIKIMANYTGTEIRFAGHSLGSQLATLVAKKLSDANSRLMPKRLELLDAFWSKNGKSWLGDTVNGTVTLACESKNSASDWTGELARCYIAKMISKNNLAVTWYKTSLIGDVGVGDANASLRPLVVFMNVKSGWWGSDKQTEKHIWAKNIYFWSKIVPSNAPNIPSYANTPLATIQANMKLKKVYTQDADTIASPANDTYK